MLHQNEMELQPQYGLSSEQKTQPIFGKVFNAFVPDVWERIKCDPDYKDLLLCIYSLDGVNWELYSSEASVVEEWHKSGSHVIVLNPDFRLEDVTDPTKVRTNLDPC